MIYFAQSTSGGSVKIGTTENLKARLYNLESHYGQHMAILATMPGGRKEEQEIHARFAHLRFGITEQFQPAADLMQFIGRPLLVNPNPETVEMMPPLVSRYGLPSETISQIADLRNALGGHLTDTAIIVKAVATLHRLERDATPATTRSGRARKG